MKIVMDQCFHWIQFHIMNKCLEEGYEVIGIDQVNSEKEEFLYSMVGRNANFTLIDSRAELPKKTKGKYVGLMKKEGDFQNLADFTFHGEQYYLVEEAGDDCVERKPNHQIIFLPPLIGGWMDQPHYENTIVSNTEIVLIDDFASWLITIFQTTLKPNPIFLNKKEENRHGNGLSLIVYHSIEEGKKQMDAHIKKYPFYYKNV